MRNVLVFRVATGRTMPIDKRVEPIRIRFDGTWLDLSQENYTAIIAGLCQFYDMAGYYMGSSPSYDTNRQQNPLTSRSAPLVCLRSKLCVSQYEYDGRLANIKCNCIKCAWRFIVHAGRVHGVSETAAVANRESIFPCGRAGGNRFQSSRMIDNNYRYLKGNCLTQRIDRAIANALNLPSLECLRMKATVYLLFMWNSFLAVRARISHLQCV